MKKKKKIIIAIWILVSVLMPIFYFGIIRPSEFDRKEYERILKEYGHVPVPDPNGESYPIPLVVRRSPPCVDVLVFIVLELGSITGLTIFIKKTD